MRLLLAMVLSLSGCASTFTVAFGEHARAAIAQPSLSCPDNSPKLGIKTTTTTEYDDKIGFEPQVDSITETTEPASPPPPAPAHESQGAALSEAGGGALRTLTKWFVCGITFGAVCLL